MLFFLNRYLYINAIVLFEEQKQKTIFHWLNLFFSSIIFIHFFCIAFSPWARISRLDSNRSMLPDTPPWLGQGPTCLSARVTSPPPSLPHRSPLAPPSCPGPSTPPHPPLWLGVAPCHPGAGPITDLPLLSLTLWIRHTTSLNKRGWKDLE